jgi:hypothetical protein
MPDSPDFEQITTLHRYYVDDDGLLEPTDHESLGELVKYADVLEALRQVWNARGAADAALFADDEDHHYILDRIATLNR